MLQLNNIHLVKADVPRGGNHMYLSLIHILELPERTEDLPVIVMDHQPGNIRDYGEETDLIPVSYTHLLESLLLLILRPSPSVSIPGIL